MLEMKFIRDNADLVRKSLTERKDKFDLTGLLTVDDKRRRFLLELETLRAERNKANDEIGILLKEKKDAKDKIYAMKEIATTIDNLESQVRDVDEELNSLLLRIPNVAHDSVPAGEPDKAVVIRSWGEGRRFDFKPATHIEIAQNLDIIDFPRAAKLSGSNFVLYKGMGARLERALINFMLDVHISKNGYTEIFPPFLVNRDSMAGTGQLPKMEEDMYRLLHDDLFLIPTAEVPVTNIYRDEVIEEAELPKCFVAYSACFRREAGSYGKDTRGLMRVHQFDKVEMVKFVKPQDSYRELESLLGNAEGILQELGLSYKVKLLSTQDLSFAASKCYDIEAYAAGIDKWLEVSSCSNFEAFQARRANIKFRRSDTRKTEFVHTLNGSGVALARTMAALLENYQLKDGSVEIPKPLRRYLDGKDRISKEG